ncbi:hypothetical protein PROPHIGD05-2_27 [Mycobacterium phage prophiGD05-2]|uniref:hypothetical protein n=1 Tax=Mycobacteroides abscessus TaxID=36809 RepID=UPI00092C4B5E|nr:hypothetical protein [Mycobacteroides abscessus]QST90100.1 hypothetical protein PROPHIGD05-2_27 [Mycobacterium phage prophiGD05-2]MDO2987892.1 hypothetical protein [Mycobacteroides abscessus subsp. massiliense]QSN50307.1 hypothetical protein I3U39_15670 [Mycobacteroides abscessus subsp. abscessus]QSN51814.1 hypothetical protein I3U39_24320 [Mycobacteroides abscessus subsp. abscessus]SII92852.1 Uncharacterised protein [Mycobacteroides abscessus subsp. abscessus]
MSERDIDGRVLKVRRCRHNLWHYYDANGNRRCAACDGHVRPVPGASICALPKKAGQ